MLLPSKQQAEGEYRQDAFSGRRSHDLRQPIQAINLFRDALNRTI